MPHKSLNFSEYKAAIQQSLNNKRLLSGITEPIALLDGFVNQPLHAELTGNLVIGGPTIPMVTVVGQHSGRLYFFALKALLPNIEI